ncbi:hypothetical protein Pam4_14 [Pseudanabaena phage Pam4]|nr:hypothetical protein Pam4_14 [Pseudanabaena phage Pam4]
MTTVGCNCSKKAGIGYQVTYADDGTKSPIYDTFSEARDTTRTSGDTVRAVTK